MSITAPSLIALLIVAVSLFKMKCAGEKSQVCRDREMRSNLSEKQIDDMIEDSFPASDPPSTY